jgi:hypothetical protein
MKLIMQVTLGVFFGGMMLVGMLCLIMGSVEANREVEALASQQEAR